MNIYDTRSISCVNCGHFLGEIEYDAQVIRPLCGKCANPLPEGENLLSTISAMKNHPKEAILA